MSTKVCSGCRYFKLNMQQFPCCDCHDGSRWEPANDGKPDNINHPAHYEGNTSLECIDVMEIAFGADAVGNFCLCNAFKYLWRYKHKGGNEDVKKAEWYLNHFESIMGEYSDVEDGYNKMRELVHVALGETK
jgi:hypothetical protein